MNLITSMVSAFFTNYILMIIVKFLPFKNKRLWSTIFVSVACGSLFFTDIIYLIMYLAATIGYEDISFSYIIQMLGSIIGVFAAYMASMSMIFQGFQGFTSRRTKKFLRESNNKGSNSIPRNVLALVFVFCFISLIVVSIIGLANYTAELLLTIIGGFVFGVIFLALAIYFFLTGNFKSNKESKGNSFMFVVSLADRYVVYTKDLSKSFTEDNALGSVKDNYFLDDYGYLITPKKKYYVKGIKVNSLNDINGIDMDLFEGDLSNVTSSLKKYQKQKITVDESFNVIKTQNI